jgi:hypothetical protein
MARPRENDLTHEQRAYHAMFRATDAKMAAREHWRAANRQDLIDELEPHYAAICEMARRVSLAPETPDER